MSVKATAAARRPALSILLRRILGAVFDWFYAWRRAGRQHLPSGGGLRFESLEPRLLLSADLVGEMPAAAVPNEVRGSEKANVGVVVRNIGDRTADVIPVVRLYASSSGQIDADAFLVGESALKSGQIKAGKSATVNVAVDASRLDGPGSYSLLAVVDATNHVRESNENNNVSTAAKPLNVAWSFGDMAGHGQGNALTLTDANGTRVTFSISGPGQGDVVRGEDGFSVHLTGTTQNSVFKVAVSGGCGYATLESVHVDGSLKQVQAAKANLAGEFEILGTVRGIELRDLLDGARLSIQGTGVPVKLTAATVTGATIVSASGFESIAIDQWRAGAAGGGSLSAPSIGKLTVDGGFAASLHLSGAQSGQTLATAKIDGRVSGADWFVGGAAGNVSAKSFDAGWSGRFQGPVNKLSSEGNFNGTLLTPLLGTLDVGGNMTGATLLIGAVPSAGAGFAPESYFGQGFLGQFKVAGTVRDATVMIGVDPVDGVYGNGNDVIVGGTASRIQQLSVGALAGSTSFTAGAFPAFVSINGRSVRSSTVSQFHTSTADTEAPVLVVTLQSDTGTSPSDGITRDPSIAGSVADAGQVVSLRAAVDSTNDADYRDILANLQPDGSFVLDAAALAAVLGGELQDGLHTVRLQAVDAAGNASTATVSFTLDTAGAGFATLALDAGSDTGVAGDGVTRMDTVTVQGTTEAGATVVLSGTDRTTVADSDGRFSFDGIALADEGGNAVDFHIMDAAGNQIEAGLHIVRDTAGPGLNVLLRDDTGFSPEDGLTSIGDLLGNVEDSAGVVSLTIAINGNAHEEAVGAPFHAFLLEQAWLAALAGGELADGVVTVGFEALDAAGNASSAQVQFLLDRTRPTLSAGLLDDTGASGTDGVTRDGSLSGETSDINNVVALTVAVDGGPAVSYFGDPTQSHAFQIEQAVLGALADGSHTYRVVVTDAAGNEFAAEVSFVLDRTPPGIEHFGLAPPSDTEPAGDGHTTEPLVMLMLTAEAGLEFTLNGDAILPEWNGSEYFIHDVALAPGSNLFTLVARDAAGNATESSVTIVRDELPGEAFPDLVVSDLQSEVLYTDEESGLTWLRIHWITSNQGSATAVGPKGGWAESVHLSYDDTPWNGDLWMASLKFTGSLEAGASVERSVDVAVDTFMPEGYRFYVVTDDEQYVYDPNLDIVEYFANEIAEKTAGEYNNLVIQDIDLGIPTETLPAGGPELPLDGSAVGGAIGEGGGSAIYTFELGENALLYFDALESAVGMRWTLSRGGEELYARSFAASDAHGFGASNPLLDLAAGSYELKIIAEAAGDYGFRLLDPDLAAAHELVLEGGPLMRLLLARGDWTDIHQFEAEAGQRYVVGGPNDWAVDGALFWRLFDPAGNQVWTGTTAPSDETAFTLTGTYTLLVEGRVDRTDPAQYNVYVFTPQDRDLVLDFAQPVRGFLDSPGQVNRYHFTLDAPTAVYFDGWLESNGPYFNWQLEKQGEIVTGGTTRDDYFGGVPDAQVMQLVPGDYVLSVAGLDNAGGWFNFQLVDLLNSPAVELAQDTPVIGAIYPGFGSALYRFDASAGQTLWVDLDTQDPDGFDPARWMLVDAAGNLMAQGMGGTVGSIGVDQDGRYSLLVQGRQFNWFGLDYALTVATSAPSVLTLGLAPQSDTGVQGDNRTTLEQVVLAGVAPPFAPVTLVHTQETVYADETGAFTFENVPLALGANTYLVETFDAQGILHQYELVVTRDAPVVATPMADLAVTAIDRQFIEVNEFGEERWLVSWTTENLGSAAAAGVDGYWFEALWYSPFDDLTFSGDDFWVGSIFVDSALEAGDARTGSVEVTLPAGLGGGRFYVFVDDGNQVYEKAAAEYNNMTLEDVGVVAPPPLEPTGPALSLAGEPTAGFLAPGGEATYAFTLESDAQVLFDALHSAWGMTWTLRDAGGNTVFSRAFDAADAFGMGPINALLPLAAGDYQVVISGGEGDFAFRLLDIAAAASHDLVFDGGALLGQVLARGDQTQVYQFHAAQGQSFVVGGPADNTVEGALYWRLFDPEGHQIWSGTASPSDVAEFQATGTYTLVVEGSYDRTDAVRYNVYVFSPQDRILPLAFGQHTQGFLDAPGQVNAYTFETNGGPFLFDGRPDSNGLVFNWAIEDAQGVVIAGTLFEDVMIDLAAGSYTLKVSAVGASSGWYNFRLFDLNAESAQLVSPGLPVSGWLAPGFTAALFALERQPGQSLTVNVDAADPELLWTLVAPSGASVSTATPGSIVLDDAFEAGAWKLIVQGAPFNWGGVPYEITVA